MAAIPPLSTHAGQNGGAVRQGGDAAAQARAAAQRAFFQAAVDRVNTPAPTTAKTVPVIPVQQARPLPAGSVEPEQTDRIARPGSLVNIVV